MIFAVSVLLVVPLAESLANAQCVPAVCALAISVQSDASGLALGGSGTAAASMSFGTMRAFGGTVPSGVTRTVTGSTWTISTPFDVQVTCSNLLTLLPCTLLLSPTFTLTAQLQSSDVTNTWKINSLALNSSTATTLVSAGSYGVASSYTFALTIPFAESPGIVSNTINFVAVAN